MSDIQQDSDLIDQKLEPYGKAIEFLMEKVECLEKVVMDDIIGGAQELCKTRTRMDGLSSFGSKYGDKIAPFKDAFSAVTDGGDMMESLYDHIDSIRNEDGFDEGGALDSALSAFEAKLNKIKGVKAEEPKVDEGEPLPEEPKAEIKIVAKKMNKAPKGSLFDR